MSIKQLFQKEQRQHYDKVFWVIMIFLVLASMLAMYSAGSQLAHKAIAHGISHLSPFYSHIVFLLAGLAIAFFVQQVPSKYIRICSYLLLGFSIVCLILIFVPGFGVEINGAKRWLRLGITFQPSELAKLSLIVVEADLLSRMDGKAPEQRRKLFLWALGLAGVVCLLIMINNLSTALMLAGVIFILMFLARVDWKVLVGMIGIAAIVLMGSYLFVEKVYVKPGKHMTGVFRRAETWVHRVDEMIDDWGKEKVEDEGINDYNRQEKYAKLAVARAYKRMPLGVGPGNSLERDYLPLAYADYIFAIIVEEWGLVGAAFLIFLYLVILFRACSSSNRFEDNAAMLMVMGLGLMLTLQAFISMAVAVGIGPVTGQALPMMSRGGSGIILCSICFGIMMAVSREQNILKAQSDKAIKESREEEPELI